MPASDGDWRRAALRRALVPLALLIVGIALLVATGDIANLVGWGAIGVALTLAVSLAFLEVGYSEDRARARERARRRRRR